MTTRDTGRSIITEPIAETQVEAKNLPDRKSLPDRTIVLTGCGLTILLFLMFTVPVVTIFALFWYLPPVHEGKLEAEIRLENVPPPSFYEMKIPDRPKIETAHVVVENLSDYDWTNFYVRVNRHYEIFDQEPIPAGETRRYRLDRFIARVGAVLDIRLVQVKHVEIYARVPEGARFTFEEDFE